MVEAQPIFKNLERLIIWLPEKLLILGLDRLGLLKVKGFDAQISVNLLLLNHLGEVSWLECLEIVG